MSRVNAVTNGAGYQLIHGIDIHNLKPVPQGKEFNPWVKVKKLTGGKEYELWQFFAENDKEQLAFREIEDFNLLASHAKWQLDLNHYEKVKIYRLHYLGAKTRLLKARDMLFMMYAGKIYTKPMKKFNQQKEKDNE